MKLTAIMCVPNNDNNEKQLTIIAYNASRAYAPTCELAIMTIINNNVNNGQLLQLFTIIVNY